MEKIIIARINKLVLTLKILVFMWCCMLVFGYHVFNNLYNHQFIDAMFWVTLVFITDRCMAYLSKHSKVSK